MADRRKELQAWKTRPMAPPPSPPRATKSQTELLREKLQRSAKKLKQKKAESLMNTPRTQARADGIMESNVRHTISLQAAVVAELCAQGAVEEARAGLYALVEETPIVLGFTDFWTTAVGIERDDEARTAALYSLALENVQGRERASLIDAVAAHFAWQARTAPRTLDALLKPPGPAVASPVKRASPKLSPVKPVSLRSVLAHEPAAAVQFAGQHAFKPVAKAVERLPTPPLPPPEQDEPNVADAPDDFEPELAEQENAVAAAGAPFASPAKPSGRFASLFASPPGRIATPAAPRSPPRSATKRLMAKSPQSTSKPAALGSVIAFEAVPTRKGAKVATPVRRSSRKQSMVPFKAQVDNALDDADGRYAPNPALRIDFDEPREAYLV